MGTGPVCVLRYCSARPRIYIRIPTYRYCDLISIYTSRRLSVEPFLVRWGDALFSGGRGAILGLKTVSKMNLSGQSFLAENTERYENVCRWRQTFGHHSEIRKPLTINLLPKPRVCRSLRSRCKIAEKIFRALPF